MKTPRTSLLALLIPLMLLVAAPASAELQKFVYAYDDKGALLTPKNAADRCPDPEALFQVTEPCKGVRVDKDGKYSIRLDNAHVPNSGNLILVANEFQFLAQGSEAHIGRDTYILLDSKRRVDGVWKGKANDGVDINNTSDAAVKALEKAHRIPAGSRGRLNAGLVEAIAQSDMSAINDALGNGREDNAAGELNQSPVYRLASSNQSRLTTAQQEVLLDFAGLAIAHQDDPAVRAYIEKSVTQAVLNPDLMGETIERAKSVISDVNVLNPGSPLMLLEADRYLIKEGETVTLSTRNSINPGAFFAYTWFGVESDIETAVFAPEGAGSYLICVSGEIDNANDSSTDCVRIVVVGRVSAVASVGHSRLPVREVTTATAWGSQNATTFAWTSGAGRFADAARHTTDWTAPTVPGTYELKLTVNGAVSDAVSILVFEVMPVAQIAIEQQRLELAGDAVTASLASRSISSDGTAVDSIAWRIIDQPVGSNASLSSASDRVVEFHADAPGLYGIELAASKGVQSDRALVEILVVKPGVPLAIAGADIETYRHNAHLLDGGRSISPDGRPLSHAWKASGGTLWTPAQARTLYRAEDLGVYQVELTVSNGVNTDVDALDVTVLNRVPALSDDAIANYLDGVVHGQLIAHDGDRDTLSYRLVTEPLNGGINLDPATGKFTYLPGGEKGCRYRPYSRPQDNDKGGKDVPVIKLCADKPYAAPGEVVNLTTSNSINASKFSGYYWVNATGDASDIRQATFSSTEVGIHEVCVVGNVGQSKNTSTACVEIEVSGDLDRKQMDDINSGYADRIQVQVSDGHDDSKVATVILRLDWRNTAPVASDSAPLTTDEDVALEGALSANDFDAHPLRYEIVSNGRLGEAVITDPVAGAFIYMPHADLHGEDSFTFRVSDGIDASNIATVPVRINSRNDAPVAQGIEGVVTHEDTPVAGGLFATDADGDAISYRLVAQAVKGVVVITDAHAGTFLYTPHLNENGHDSFSYVANDGAVDSGAVQVSIQIIPVNDAPSADGIAIQTWLDVPLHGKLTGADVDLEPLSYRIVRQPGKGTIELDGASGRFTFTPDGSATGTDQATFVVNDGTVSSVAANIDIRILPANLPPVAQPMTIRVLSDALYTNRLSGSDAHGDPLRYAVVDQGKLGNARVTEPDSGLFTYYVNINENTRDNFTFNVSDGDKSSSKQNVNVIIVGNDQVCAGPGHDPVDADMDGYADYVELEFNTSLSNGQETPKGLSASALGVSFSDDDDADGYLDYAEIWMGADFNSADSRISDSLTATLPRCMMAGNDVVPPRLQAFNITTPVIDVSGGGVTAGFALTVIDNAAGVSAAEVKLVSPSGIVKHAKLKLDQAAPVLYAEFATEAFSRYAEAGDWVVKTLTLKDGRGNVVTLTTEEMVALGYPSLVKVINPNADLLKPALESFAILTPVVDANDQEPVARFSYTASDDVSGVKYVSVRLRSPSAAKYLWGEYTAQTPSTSINATMSTAPFERYDEAGIWKVVEILLRDDAGNTEIIDAASIVARGFPTDVELVNQQVDGEAPVLGQVSAVSDIVDAGYGQCIKFTVDASDTGCGIKAISIDLVGPSAQKLSIDYSHPVSESNVHVTLTLDILPRNLEPGTWTAYRLVITDCSGNARAYDIDERILVRGVDRSPNNTPPVAYSDNVSLEEDAVWSGKMRATDADGDPLEFFLVGRPAKGSVSIINAATGDYRYTPFADAYGRDSFTFQVNDGYADSNAATISIDIVAAQDAPLTRDIEFTTRQNVVHEGRLPGADTDGDALTFRIVSNGSLGAAHVLDAATGEFRYTPNPDVYGSDQFTFEVSDAGGASALATARVVIEPDMLLSFKVMTPVVDRTSDSPWITAAVTPNLKAGSIYMLHATLTDSSGVSYELGARVFASSTYPVYLTRRINASAPMGVWKFSNVRFISSKDYVTTVTLSADPGADGFSDTVLITEPQTGEGTLPVASGYRFELFENSVYKGNLIASAGEGRALSFSLVTHPSLGNVSMDRQTGAFSYVPFADTIGEDSFSFAVSDGTHTAAPAAMSVTILNGAQACGAGGIVRKDADGDGFSDTVETAYGTRVDDASSTPLEMLNVMDIDFAADADADGYRDDIEDWLNTNPYDNASAPWKFDPGNLPACFDPKWDNVKPRLLGFNIMTPVVDIANGDSRISVAMALADNASGIKRVRLSLLSPSGAFVTSTRSYDDFPRLRGDVLRTESMDRYTEEGVWKVSGVTIYDEAGNRLSLGNRDLADAGFATDIQVINFNSDATAPVLHDFRIITPTVYPAGGDARMSFEAVLGDSGSGISAARIDLRSPSGVELTATHILQNYQASATLRLDTAVLSTYLEQGSWTITGLMVFDGAGNSAQLIDDLNKSGYATRVEVINPGSDNLPPALRAFSILTHQVYPLSGVARVSYAVTADDNAAGIDAVYINLRGPSGQLLPTWAGFGVPAPVSINAQIDSARLSAMMEKGAWRVESIVIVDQAGNAMAYEGSELLRLGHPVEVQVLY